MQPTTDFFQQTSKVLTVSELTRSIRGTLETKFGAVWVQGEISNYKLHPSGHQYFTLKDQRAQIACVIWRDAMAPLRQPLADGAQVQVYGTVTVFEAQGKYQLRVEILQPRGARSASGKVRSAQAQTGGGRTFRRGAEARSAEISETHRDRHFAKRRGHPRYSQRFETARSVVANFD